MTLISRFVAALNAGGLSPLPSSEVPESLRTATPSENDEVRWEIKAIDGAPWLAEFESALPLPLPPSYRELLMSYQFAQFEIDPIMFFANTGTPVFNELSGAAFVDKRESRYLLDAGYIQFGREAGDGCDPICFDTTQMDLDGEYPVVRIDHEEILNSGIVTVRQVLAPSFAEFVRSFLSRTEAATA